MPNEHPLGTILREGDQIGLRYERRLAHPPEKVWRALTESEHIRHWLPTDIIGERAAGASIELPFWPEHVERYGIEKPVLHGEIRAWEPPSLFEWTWETDVLRWELGAVEGGTLLVFTTWLSDPDPTGAVGVSAGYHVCLDVLEELLDTGAVGVRLIDREDAVAPLEARYAEAMSSAA
jgi:uncharacterized protein YndB with AHSA1/START domain